MILLREEKNPETITFQRLVPDIQPFILNSVSILWKILTETNSHLLLTLQQIEDDARRGISDVKLEAVVSGSITVTGSVSVTVKAV